MMQRRILDLDLGNTRLKWRYRAGDSMEEGVLNNQELRTGLLLPELTVERIRLAAVVADDLLESVLHACHQRWDVEPEIATVQERCADIRQGYRNPAGLGVDRWLGILAAYAQVQTSCVVVSCGTALTVDLVTAEGEHLGGYIVPGLEMMRTALFSGTHAVKLDRLEAGADLAPGRDTREAVSRGLVLMVEGLVCKALDTVKTCGREPEIVLTGGDGERLLTLWSAESTKVRYLPNLVLDGLALALP